MRSADVLFKEIIIACLLSLNESSSLTHMRASFFTPHSNCRAKLVATLPSRALAMPP